MSEKGHHEVTFDYPKGLFVKIDFNDFAFGERFFSHWHDRVEILVVLEGCLQVFCDGETYEVNAGEIIYVNPNQIHSGTAGKNGVKYLVFTTEYKFLLSGNMDAGDKLLLEMQNGERVVTNYIKSPDIFESLMCLADIEYEKKPFYETLMRGQLLLCLGKLISLYSVRTTIKKAESSGKMTAISQVLDYISKHYREDISSQSLAEHFGFSLSYFCRYFKQKTGETVTDYINSVRLEHARGLLLDYSRSLSVAEVAEMVGFTNIGYFNTKFKEMIGETPLQYQKHWTVYNQTINAKRERMYPKK